MTAATPTWTERLPTEPGWYWRRWWSTVEMCYIRQIVGRLVIVDEDDMIYGRDERYLVSLTSAPPGPHYLWWGPITPPAPPALPEVLP